MTPKEREHLRDWAVQTLYLAMNERVNSGPRELEEQMLIRAKASAGQFFQDAEAECSRPGDVVVRVATKVFDWVGAYRSQAE